MHCRRQSRAESPRAARKKSGGIPTVFGLVVDFVVGFVGDAMDVRLCRSSLG